MSTTYGLQRSLLLDRGGAAVHVGDRSLTFAELADRAARFAGALQNPVAVRDEAPPLSGAGKILKRELPKPFWGGRARQVS